MAKKSIGTKAPAKYFINSGVIKGATTVATAVSVTERAILALAKYAITLEAKPLGEEPIRTTPAAISAGKSNKVARLNPKMGMMLN